MSPRLFAVSLVALITACGGKVVVGASTTGEGELTGSGGATSTGTPTSTGASPGESSCVQLCTAANACPGTTDPVDCPVECAKSARVASKGGCPGAFEDAYACFVGTPNVCNPPGDTCLAESKTLFMCIYSYCGAAPSDPDCD